jgi:hypothetical protein
MNPERNEQINAYLSGTMPPEEARRFERLLREDADLESEVRLAREALDAARQWAAAEVPNAQEQAARLKVPRIAPAAVIRTSARGARPVFARYLAAAALFLAGILVGAMWPRGMSPGGPRETASPGPGVVSPVLPASATPAPEKQVIPPEVPVAPRPALADAGRNAPKEEAAPPARGITPLRVVESGAERLVLESTLEGSGGRATWVVDGSFRLAENKAGGI